MYRRKRAQRYRKKMVWLGFVAFWRAGREEPGRKAKRRRREERRPAEKPRLWEGKEREEREELAEITVVEVVMTMVMWMVERRP